MLQALVERRAGRRPHRFHNMTVGAPTAKLDSRHGNIFATLRVVGESAVLATATIRATTRNSNIVLELVRQFVPLPMQYAPNTGGSGLQVSLEDCSFRRIFSDG